MPGSKFVFNLNNSFGASGRLTRIAEDLHSDFSPYLYLGGVRFLWPHSCWNWQLSIVYMHSFCFSQYAAVALLHIVGVLAFFYPTPEAANYLFPWLESSAINFLLRLQWIKSNSTIQFINSWKMECIPQSKVVWWRHSLISLPTGNNMCVSNVLWKHQREILIYLAYTADPQMVKLYCPTPCSPVLLTDFQTSLLILYTSDIPHSLRNSWAQGCAK